ncbi:dnaJ homolog subfamily C member 3 [Anabrus simplex]|uniref:dnaJ homolog subfamily C member 3 n=1 Tax=Anabrus simplex TaxID=316456 RepID=UPI0034DD19DA
MECLQPVLSSKIVSAWMLFLILDGLFDVSLSTSQAEVNKHLDLGRELLSRGQLQDALSHFHAAVEGDPRNYLTYFKRATVYLALGKAKLGLTDLDTVIELKPDFTAARLQRGLVHMKLAHFDEARGDLETVLQLNPYNEEAMLSYSRIGPVKEDIELAQDLYRRQDYPAAIDVITRIIEVCPWASWLRELRADCHTALGDTMSAISDIRTTTKLQSDNTGGYRKLAALHYQLGEAGEALKEIRELLKLDPDHKEGGEFYRKVKKVAKFLDDAQEALNGKNYARCIDSANKVLHIESSAAMIKFHAKDKLCSCYLHSDKLELSLRSCGEALEISKEPRILCDRAEAYINSELYDDAIRDYKDALEIDEHFQRAKEGLDRARKLQKQSEQRDYYKILGVRRNANKQEIIKAYRKQAQKWHPDNFQGEEKKSAEKKFIDIAAAKEVLTDPEKRRQFDQGEDPLDPESGQHQGFNPFQHHHGFQHTWKFHFN